MIVEIISLSPRKYGTGPGSHLPTLDLQSHSHLLPDTLPTALRGPVAILGQVWYLIVSIPDCLLTLNVSYCFYHLYFVFYDNGRTVPPYFDVRH